MKLRSLICLVLIHIMVDSYGQLISPLWPHLKRTLTLSPWALTFLIASWQVSTSISQPIFAYWGDRFGSRWLVALGPALAILCISLIGLADGPASLAVLLIVGGLGIGAFHPEAAVGVADASGTRATAGLALFTCGGMLGLGIGPILSGTMTEAFGLPSLTWIMMPCLLLLAILLVLLRPDRLPALHNPPGAGLAQIIGGRWLATTLLLAVGTLRVVPALGVPLGLAFLLDQRSATPAAIGWSQSLFLLSGGLGTLLCPLIARPGRERFALFVTIVPAAGCLVLITQPQPWVYYPGIVGAGLLLQGAIPILIAYSQRLLPQGRRLGASLTLGTSWGLGGLIVAGLQAYCSAMGRLDWMLWALVPFGLAAALVTGLLPPPVSSPQRDLIEESIKPLVETTEPAL